MAQDQIISEGLSVVMPKISSGGITDSIIILVIILLVGGLLAVLSIWLVKKLKFNKTIVLYRKVGNQNVPVLIDKGMFERIGNAGDYWCVLKKTKKVIPRPRIQMKKNEYWFYERDDGEWINFSLADFDTQMREAKAHYIDEDMRLQRLGIQKNLRDNFKKVTFWEKYGGMITSFLFVLIVSIMFIVLAKEWSGAIQSTSSMAEAVKEMAMAVNNLRGTGVVPI